ncbi:MAG: MaoC family dehydratase N-terminal domain-containing protein [Acidimicrobiales bacterium]|jgi:acyl dehydratase|nr:MaoC family dehydratase N-terminal domain-containing protein [Acidimicrobiales bacterium]
MGAAEDDGFTGRVVDTWPMDDEMGPALVRLWCEVLEDANPAYWDEAFAAASRFGGLIAPPPMLMSLTTRPEWTPTGARAGIKDQLASGTPDHPYAALLRVVQTYHRPMRMGERPTIRLEQGDPSPEVDTERGRGRIVPQRFVFVDAVGEELAVHQVDQLRYRERQQPEQPAAPAWSGPVAPTLARDQTRCWDDVVVGELGAPVALPVTLKRCIMWVAATRDFYEVHHDPAYAKASGDPDLFIGVHFGHGLVGRVATDWAGPEAQLRRLEFRTYGRVYLDDTLTAQVRVLGRSEVDGDRRVELEVATWTSLGLTHAATVELSLPG